MAARIQRAFRNYMRYKHECARRIQRFWKNNKEGIVYAQIREYGHDLLASRKERRRFSLISYRRFMGDYLDINGKSSLGEEVGNAAGIGSQYTSIGSLVAEFNETTGDSVIFSSRIQLLVSKFGRSSKPSPRFLVLVRQGQHQMHMRLLIVYQTGKALHIVLVNEAGTFVCERKIPLVTIKSIGLSNLRDDWLVS